MDYREFLPILEQRVVERYGRDHPYYRSLAHYYRNRGERLKQLVQCVATHTPFPLHNALVLDIGCGTGSATVEMARLGARVMGLDMDEEFGLPLARIRTHDEPVLTLLKGDALQLPFADGQIDFCFSFNAIEHFPDYQRTVDEIYRVTRPGGAAYIETANKNWPWEVHTQLLFAGWLPHAIANVYVKLRGRRRWSDTWDVRPISYGGLRRALERAGFVVLADFADLIDYNTSPAATMVRRAATWKLPIQHVMQNIKLLAQKPAA